MVDLLFSFSMLERSIAMLLTHQFKTAASRLFFWSSWQIVELSRAAGLKLLRYARILPVMSRYGIRRTSSRKLASKRSFVTGAGRHIEDLRRDEDFKLSLLLVPIITVPNSGIRAAPAHVGSKAK
jgi:hypothetical protein